MSSVIDAVAEAIRADEDLEIYTSGATNMFKYPELMDSGKATDIINTFENREELEKIVNARWDGAEVHPYVRIACDRASIFRQVLVVGKIQDLVTTVDVTTATHLL